MENSEVKGWRARMVAGRKECERVFPGGQGKHSGLSLAVMMAYRDCEGAFGFCGLYQFAAALMRLHRLREVDGAWAEAWCDETLKLSRAWAKQRGEDYEARG